MFGSDAIKSALIKQLDAASLRQRVIADNIANINTPGFKKSAVNFEAELARALDESEPALLTAHPRHISGRPSLARLVPEVVEVKGTAMRVDGNNVDIDREMVDLAKNSLLYSATAQFLSQRKSILSHVVQEGR